MSRSRIRRAFDWPVRKPASSPALTSVTSFVRLVLAVFAAMPAATAMAQPAALPAQELGGLQVFPTRVLLDGRTRTAALTLNNSGTKPTTYRISLIEMRMTDTGAVIAIKEGENVASAASPYLRYSPRQVTLEPKSPQSVRIQVRKPADLPPGEYRSHLLFRAIPEPDAETARADGGVTVVGAKLVAVYGVAIPVIVRHGETTAKITLAAPTMEHSPDGKQRFVSIDMRREGNRSAFGDFTAQWVPPKGAPIPLGEKKGVAIYVPNAAIRVRIPIDPMRDLKGGKVRVEFAEASALPISTAEIMLP